ncbi:MAG TPA: type II secretion system F family protein [Candidatus Gracilibacteria bacterium]
MESLKKEIVLNISAKEKAGVSARLQKKESFLSRLQRISTISRKEILFFFELLGNLNNAGLPINQSLEILETQTPNPRLKYIISQVRNDIKSGFSFSQSLRKHPKIFDEATCAVIQAGEKSGKLNDILKELIRQMQRMDEIRNQIKSIMIYPIIVFCVMIILVAILLIFVVPKLEDIFNGMNNLPLPTKILVGMSDFFIHQWYVVLLGIIGMVACVHIFHGTKLGVRFFDRLLISIPIFGRMVKKTILSRITRLFGLLLSSGVPIVESLRLSSNIAGNIVYKEKLLLASHDISRGIPLAENLSDNEKLFPSMLVQMISIGERTASLDVVVERVAKLYDEELSREIKSLSKILEPFILAIIAAGAVFMIMAIYLPILQMNDQLM